MQNHVATTNQVTTVMCVSIQKVRILSRINDLYWNLEKQGGKVFVWQTKLINWILYRVWFYVGVVSSRKSSFILRSWNEWEEKSWNKELFHALNWMWAIKLQIIFDPRLRLLSWTVLFVDLLWLIPVPLDVMTAAHIVLPSVLWAYSITKSS